MTPGTEQSPSDPAPAAPSACPHCRYDLKGLPPLSHATPCPECGYPIGHIIPPEQWLRHADPAWFRRVRIGLKLQSIVVFTVVALFLTGIILILVGLVIEIAGLPDVMPEGETPVWLDVLFGVSLLVPVPLMHSLGCWLASSPPPQQAPPDAHSRKWLRVAGTPLTALLILSMLLWMLFPDTPVRWVQIARPLFFTGLSAAYLYALTAWCKHLQQHTDTWTARDASRIRRLRINITLATVLSSVFGWAWYPLCVANSRPGLGQQTAADHSGGWGFWMFLGYIAVLQMGVEPLLKAIRREERARRWRSA